MVQVHPRSCRHHRSRLSQLRQESVRQEVSIKYRLVGLTRQLRPESAEARRHRLQSHRPARFALRCHRLQSHLLAVLLRHRLQSRRLLAVLLRRRLQSHRLVRLALPCRLPQSRRLLAVHLQRQLPNRFLASPRQTGLLKCSGNTLNTGEVVVLDRRVIRVGGKRNFPTGSCGS
jgi:hypothetical protein